ncbi:heat-labile enterotoxin alpha chain-domain-containing protein [Colletotrichum cereale]|nr:heat-labile enterotoxin alpha chain-domain-containing protein [Colletotrichum cereale]
MANRHSVFVYFYLASLWFLLGGAAFLKQTSPKFVYRPDTRTPKQIEEAGGFLPQDRSPDADFSIFNHVNAPNNKDAYVSLTTSSLAKEVSANRKDASVLYIYKVKTTPNIYDVDKTLGEYNPQTSKGNFAALGGVKWDQIVSWRMGNGAGWLGSTKNVDYNKKYNGLKAGGAQPSLAGFPADSEAWNKEPWAQFKPRDHIGKKDGKDAEGDDGDELVNSRMP